MAVPIPCPEVVASRARRLRVALVVGGFPDADHPISNVFGVRAARALARETDLTTIVLRAWVPGRRLRKTEVLYDLAVTTTAAPQLPRAGAFNLLLYRTAGWPLVRSLLHEVDVVHSGDLSSIGIIAGGWARRARKAHVTQATQCMRPDTVPHLWGTALDGWRDEVDGIACNSDALRSDLQRFWPDLPHVRTIYRGVDINLFRPHGPLYDMPAQTGVTVRFLYAGGFPAYPSLPHAANTKGGFTLLRAWAANEDELHGLGAALFIAGPDCDRRDVAAWHAQLRHPERVVVLGAVPGDLMPNLMRACDAVLVPSLQEGLPNVSVEASATATAVIGSDIPPMREVIVDGVSGVLVPPGDEAAWSRALCTAARQPGTLERYGQSARARVEARFDHRNYAANMTALYEAAIQRHASARGARP